MREQVSVCQYFEPVPVVRLLPTPKYHTEASPPSPKMRQCTWVPDISSFHWPCAGSMLKPPFWKKFWLHEPSLQGVGSGSRCNCTVILKSRVPTCAAGLFGTM